MGIFRVLVLIGFVVKFWWLVLLLLGALAVGWWALVVWTRHDDELERRRRAQAAIVARADEQHAWVLDGDDRGVYGETTRPLRYCPGDNAVRVA